jgi:hypothetical protein
LVPEKNDGLEMTFCGATTLSITAFAIIDYTGNTKGGSVTIDLLFDWFGLVCLANKNKKMSVVIQLIPNQANRRSMVQ